MAVSHREDHTLLDSVPTSCTHLLDDMMILEDVHGQNLKLLCTNSSTPLLVLGRQVSFKSPILSPPLQYEVSITPSAHMVITVKNKGVMVGVLCELKSCIQTESARICLSLTGEVAFTSVYCEHDSCASEWEDVFAFNLSCQIHYL